MSLLSRLAVQAARAYGALSKGGVSASYLVVAGGGGGGSAAGGGAGAGGLLTSTATLSTLTTYTVTVGAGGLGGTSGAQNNGTQGSNSVLSGTGLTTVTSTGGGYGGTFAVVGGNGGSGGGGGGRQAAAGGTGVSGQGFAGGASLSGNTSTTGRGGGGGGSSAVGATGDASGNGGAGTASSITGSSVTYAGGGGGGNYNQAAVGSGGSGGGGAGGFGSTSGADTAGAGTAGTANTGGGGGGGGSTANANNALAFGAGANGGSGVVIISYTSATPKFVGGTLTTSGGKQIHTFTSSGTLSPITPITASYLVVAGGGGGGGGNYHGGGGGAGGLLTSSTTLYSGATYIVTVGAGGAGGVANAKGVAGSNSVLSGTGITTVTTTGGGGAGTSTNGFASTLINGNSGGSGGGAGGISQGGGSATGGAGTSGQGNAGGNVGGNIVPYRGGGGGGAGAVGATGGSGTGNGGAGTASSITGSSVTYAGGGGGCTYSDPTPGTGGAGGGGNGGSNTVTPTAGTANTGGGGGGAERFSTATGGAGGSGIVIISYAGSQAFNGGLVTTSGGNTIHTFNATGALTPLTNNLNNSLRFRRSASAYLSRTPASASNRTTMTFSAWIKRGALGDGGAMFNARTTSSPYSLFHFYSNDTLVYEDSNTAFLQTTQVFRDPSAWYHIVLAIDTTQATAANRVKIYVNGSQVTALSTATYPAQNANTNYNTATAHAISSQNPAFSNEFFDGYMTDINFIDGQALEPYYFGNNDANGVWKPILYKGMYGTNGFYLTFGNTTSTTTLGYDSSPNGNNWTTNNISLTAGTTYDAMTDVPTNTSATVANYAVANPLDKSTNVTVTNGNLTVSTAVTNAGIRGSMYVSSGKYYWEATCTTKTNYPNLGIADAAWGLTNVGSTSGSYGYATDGLKYNNGSTASYGATYTSGDVIGVALDLDAGTLVFYKNNTSQGTAYSSLSGTFAPAFAGQTSDVWNMNFGQRPFQYSAPSGFLPLNTYNLPTPTILQGNKYMDATLYTGTRTTQVVVNSGQFKPDMVWCKSRSFAAETLVSDSVRGTTKQLFTSRTNAEQTDSTMITSLNSNGFTLGDNSGGPIGNINYNIGATYVGWQWQAGQGSTSSNTQGSITSTVSVNTTAGFSVVTYTGTGANATVGHGLGVAPKFFTVKRRSAVGNWMTWHTSLTGTGPYLILNSTNAAAAGAWNNTLPTSTVFSLLGSDTDENANGSTYVAYCWAEIAGYSKFGSYTGNGSADGTFVYTGFRPKWILIKNASNGVQGWTIQDTSRSTYNVVDNYLLAQASSAEQTIYAQMDYLSNGFKVRTSDALVNGSGNTIIYAAFAENPFKNANAR